MKRVVQFSGGIGSWAAAKMVANIHGTADLVLLFADVKDEHEDLYRFIQEGAANIGVPVTVIADGRTPRQVMTDEKFIGNSRRDPCSKILKRELLDRWCRDNCDPEDTMRYIGIDWTEAHRLETFKARVSPWSARAPLVDAGLSKVDARLMLQDEGIAEPLLYQLGFPHNNCGGACIKAGQAQWALLLKHDPERFLSWETWEHGMRETVGDHSILRDRTGGVSRSLPLRAFRLRVESQQTFDKQEWGGCGCAL